MVPHMRASGPLISKFEGTWQDLFSHVLDTSRSCGNECAHSRLQLKKLCICGLTYVVKEFWEAVELQYLEKGSPEEN